MLASRMARAGWTIASALALAALLANPGASQTLPLDCDGPAGDPDPSTQPDAYLQRDVANMLCSLQRIQDEYTNPAFFLKFQIDETPRTYSDNVLDQLREPNRPRVTLAQWIPGGTTADPYRVPEDWESAGRGRVEEVSFIAADGAKLVGRLFTPNPADPPVKLPAVVITTGSIQGYQELYYWAAEGLAEAGYMVLAYDVQGQGRSETLPHAADGSIACTASGCSGVPFQQGYNFYQGTRDALNFLLSTPTSPYANAVGSNAVGTNSFNPLWAALDRDRVGLAGHSLGASAVSVVGQSYPGAGSASPAAHAPADPANPSVKAIVAWDALSAVPTKDANGDQIVDEYDDENGNSIPAPTVPALSLTAEYFLNPEPMNPSAPPDPQSKSEAFQQLAGLGVDTMLVQLRSSTHLEFSYVPYILPASRHGERVSMYYTLAWFDRYLKGDGAATDRLKALSFDGSADASSIGGGTFDPTKIQPGMAGADGNVPYRIEGNCVANRLSIYYDSKYFLGGDLEPDMRGRGCP